MAGRIVSAVHISITGATAAGLLTMASSTGLYAGAKAWIAAIGQPNRLVTITGVPDATHCTVRFDNDPHGGGIGSTTNDLIGVALNYGNSDISAYNGGTLDQLKQLIYNPNDAPLN